VFDTPGDARRATLAGMSTFITRFDHPGPGWRVAVKDLIDIAGVPTTNGSRVVAATAGPADHDAPCLAATRAGAAAGQITLVGKTNQHELAFGITGINPWFGTPVNPIDARLVPGGSSSGSAVAVATGEADLAFGSDTGGSIRIPAACCAIVGLKTTRGSVPLDGVRPLAPSLDTVGPMARTVDGVARGLALLDPRFSPDNDAPLRLGRLRLPAEPRIDTAIDRALAAAGLEVTDVDVPGWDAATEATMVVLGAEAWRVHAGLWRDHAGDLSPDVSVRLETSSHIDAAAVAAARRQGRAWEAELDRLLHTVDLIALPTLAGPPPRLEDGQRLSEIRYGAAFNLAGWPALAMPVATAAGFVASLQLAGPPGSEARILAAGAAVEAAAAFAR
jgi:amidase